MVNIADQASDIERGVAAKADYDRTGKAFSTVSDGVYGRTDEQAGGIGNYNCMFGGNCIVSDLSTREQAQNLPLPL